MSLDIDDLFEGRPIAEIIEISPQDRETIIEEAERFFIHSTLMNGGSLTDLYKAMIRSIVESFARQEAIERTGKCSILDMYVYKRALENFNNFIEKYSTRLDHLNELWLNKAKSYITNVFEKINKVFEPYLLGELCEKLYLNNKGAKSVLEELKKEGFIIIISKQYGHNLLARD